MAKKPSERDHSLALLERLMVSLEWSDTLRLTSTERDYLMRACRRALAGHHDPLAIGRPTGGQRETRRLMQEAMMVHERIKRGATLREACIAVASEIGNEEAGEKSGALEKNYREHRDALKAADRFYAARNEGRTPDTNDLLIILGGKSPGK